MSAEHDDEDGGAAAAAAAEVEEDETLKNDQVVEKYKQAGTIVNTTLKGLGAKMEAGKTPGDLAKLGDMLIKVQCDKVFKNRNMPKGVGFPVCVSVNECVGNFSPLKSDSSKPLAEGDLVKVSCGVHLDGYLVVAAHTFRVRKAAAEGAAPAPVPPTPGPAADVTLGAYLAAQAAFKSMQPGATNADVTAAVAQVAKCFGVAPCQGVLMHRIKRWIIDSNEVVILREEEPDHHVEEFTFEPGNVYTVDVVFSTGAGKPTTRDVRTTVFKRASDEKYQLKSKASRALLSAVQSGFRTFPFTLRLFEDENEARLGIKECVEHELVQPYPVMFEKPGDLVAHFQFTVLISPSGKVEAIGGLKPADVDVTKEFVSDKALTPELLALVNREDKKKKKAAPAAAGGAADSKTGA